MTIRKSLIICLPLLAAVACKAKGTHKSNAPAAIAVPGVAITAESSNATPAGPEVPVLPASGPSVPPAAGAADAGKLGSNQSQSNQSVPGIPGGAGVAEVRAKAPSPPGAVGTTAGKADPVLPPAVTAPPAQAAQACETLVIDFDKKPDGTPLLTGEKLKDQYQAYGIEFEAERRLENGRLKTILPVLFNTADRPNEAMKAKFLEADRGRHGNGEGFDFDLTTEKNGKAMIIAEHSFDALPDDGLDLVTYPDDNLRGGVLTLLFSKPSSVINMDLIDFESKGSEIELFIKADNGDYVSRPRKQSIPARANGALQTLSVDDHEYINKMMLHLSGTGAVDNIKICIKN